MVKSQVFSCLLVASAALAAPASGSDDPATSASSLAVSSVVTSALSSAVPASSGSAVSSAAPESETVAPASDDPNFQVYPQGTNETPEAINGQLGASVIVPDNTALDQQNPDFLAPPSTDHGST